MGPKYYGYAMRLVRIKDMLCNNIEATLFILRNVRLGIEVNGYTTIPCHYLQGIIGFMLY